MRLLLALRGVKIRNQLNHCIIIRCRCQSKESITHSMDVLENFFQVLPYDRGLISDERNRSADIHAPRKAPRGRDYNVMLQFGAQTSSSLHSFISFIFRMSCLNIRILACVSIERVTTRGSEATQPMRARVGKPPEHQWNQYNMGVNHAKLY